MRVPRPSNFYITGGALPPNAPSYVERRADTDLYEALTAGELCYVLTPRQMGKSSLMVRTAARLREVGRTVVALDLTAIGHHVTIEQWYSGLLWSLGRQLDIEDALDDHWQKLERLAPLQRFMASIHDVVLSRSVSEHASLVIFVDEIDLVRSLPFSADEFFGAIRETVQRRHFDPAMARTTFCLLGVAAPADLIENADMTPFNIGKRIELHDFEAEEAAPLAAGIERAHGTGDGARAEKALRRVLWWTGGHPYLTQRLCAAIAAETSTPDDASVDAACGRLFLGDEAQSTDPNLAFVAQQLVGPDEPKVRALMLYGRILRGAKVSSADAGETVERLLLSGIVKANNGHLRVRNRIYERVFCRRWVLDHMPDQEVRRQRAAYRRGVMRTALAAGLVLAIMAALALTAWRQSRIAARERNRAEQHLYVTDMNLAEYAWQELNTGRMGQLLERHRPGPGEVDRRGFEWRYRWGLLHQDMATLEPDGSLVFDVRVSADGRWIASAQGDHSVRLFDARSRRQIAALRGHSHNVLCVRFSPDASLMASGSEDGTVRIWRTNDWKPIRALRHGDGVQDLAWDRQSRIVVTVSWDKLARGWDADTGVELWRQRFAERAEAVACSPTHDLALLACRTGLIRMVRATTGDTGRNRQVAQGIVGCAAFSPDGETVAVGYGDGRIRFWRSASLQPSGIIRVGRQLIDDIAWSRDNERIATASWDSSVRILDARTLKERRRLLGHQDMVTSVAWEPNNRVLYSSGGESIKAWDTSADPPSGAFRLEEPAGTPVAFLRGDTVVVCPKSGALSHALPWRDRHFPTAPMPGSVRWAEWSERASLCAWMTERRVAFLDGSLREVRAIELHGAGDYTGLSWSPDGARVAIAIGNPTPRIEVRDARSLRVVRWFGQKPHDNYITSLAWSPDGKLLVSSGWDGKIVVRDLEAGSLRWFQASGPSTNCVAFCPDRRTLATGGDDSMLRLWDTETWTEIVRMRLPDHVLRVAFSQDGRHLAAYHSPDIVRWWSAPALSECDALAR